jgi:hypothetical protein
MVLALVSAGLLAQPADARDRERRGERQEQAQPEPAREERRERRGERAAAAAKAQRQNGGGRVLSVEPEGQGYRVKVLKDGEVRTHHVD